MHRATLAAMQISHSPPLTASCITHPVPPGFVQDTTSPLSEGRVCVELSAGGKSFMVCFPFGDNKRSCISQVTSQRLVFITQPDCHIIRT